MHEIKHDGYRLMVRRDELGVRLLTRNGHNWTSKYPAIKAAADKVRAGSFLIDGEAVCCSDGTDVPEFNLLRANAAPSAVFLLAFDLLMLDGADLREHPIEARKRALAKLVRKLPAGIQICDHIEGDGAMVFASACALGLEGIVSKRRGSRYTSGRSTAWLKTKNPASPAMRRLREEDWNRPRSRTRRR